MPRHRGTPPRRYAAGGAALLLALGGAGVWAVITLTDLGGTDAPRNGQPSASVSGTTPSASASGSGAPASTEPTGSGTTIAAATVTQSLTRCRSDVQALERVAAAAGNSARDWGIHTDAQLKLDAGTFTVAQAEAAWAASKARGPADLKAFRSAMDAAAQAANGCRTVAADTKGSPSGDAGLACASRQQALTAVATAGTRVNDQWAAHMDMMANKAHTDGASYRRRWAQMVSDAQPALAAYRASATALSRAPACPT